MSNFRPGGGRCGVAAALGLGGAPRRRFRGILWEDFAILGEDHGFNMEIDGKYMGNIMDIYDWRILK